MQNETRASRAQVTLIAGDGIGPEVTRSTVRLIEAAGAEIEWVEMNAQPIISRNPEEIQADPVVASIRETRVGLKGPLTTPIGGGHQSINVVLRKALDLYA